MFQFARAAQESELDPAKEGVSRSFVLGTITSSVAFLESLINEVFLLAKGQPELSGLPASSREAMTDLWDDVAQRVSILAKYDLVLALAVPRRRIDHGGKVYQDASALVQLRNAIVHYQVGWRDHPDPTPLKIEKVLQGKFPRSPYYPRQPFFPHACLSAGCAVWAVKGARAFADKFYAELGTAGYYQQVQGIPALLP